MGCSACGLGVASEAQVREPVERAVFGVAKETEERGGMTINSTGLEHLFNSCGSWEDVYRALVDGDFDLVPHPARADVYTTVRHATTSAPQAPVACADATHPYAGARVQVEDEIRQMVERLPEHAQAVLYKYLYALDWRIEKARNVARRAFGAD